MKTKVIAPSNRLARHYAQRIRQIKSRFNDIRELIQHEGMKGARVEQEVRKFLTDFLPEQYQYSSGIVIDNSGGECDRSRQEDILIIDRFFNPKLFLDEEPSTYPVEVVYCGIEVKTCLDKENLKNAVDNIASLKNLNYVHEKVAYVRGNGMTVSSTTSPIGIIFAFDSSIKSAETLLKHLDLATKDIAPQCLPNFICILNRGLLGFNKKDKPVFQLFGLLGEDSSGRVGELSINMPSNKSIDKMEDQYSTILIEGNYYIVDIARTFTAFLNYLYESLMSKVIIANSNLLRHYVPENMLRSIVVEHQDDEAHMKQI